MGVTISCKKTGRSIELDAGYFEIANRRIQGATEKQQNLSS